MKTEYAVLVAFYKDHRPSLLFFFDSEIITALWQTGHRPETSINQGSKQVF